mmetsp:Transcript_16733/g.25284  ORF Transcript_16733/g.25284 Transcript_16733/m.25284 type:complete len:167 (-) Transcript_16733:74-574(-)
MISFKNLTLFLLIGSSYAVQIKELVSETDPDRRLDVDEVLPESKTSSSLQKVTSLFQDEPDRRLNAEEIESQRPSYRRLVRGKTSSTPANTIQDEVQKITSLFDADPDRRLNAEEMESLRPSSRRLVRGKTTTTTTSSSESKEAVDMDSVIAHSAQSDIVHNDEAF